MNGLVMYDHQTDSLWSQVTGSSISGDFENTSLRHLAALQTTWAAWVGEHPETLVLDKSGSRMYESDPYASYYKNDSAGLFGESNIDTRVGPKEFVAGLKIGHTAKAYPFRELAKTPVVNDIAGSRSIVVVFDSDAETAIVFNRKVNGNVLRFRAGDTSDSEFFIDSGTGSKWSKRSGKAVEGPLENYQLEQVPSTTLFWFAWSDFHPDTDVYATE
jgi:hypothetical protein